MQIEVLFYPIKDGQESDELKSQTLDEYGDIIGAVSSVEKRVSLGRTMRIFGTIVHNPNKSRIL